MRGEVGHQRFRARIGQHAADLLFQYRGLLQLAGSRERLSSSSSGMLLQRKNERREASSRSLTGWAAPGVAPGGIALDAIQELRAHQQPFESGLNAQVEVALLAAGS